MSRIPLRLGEREPARIRPAPNPRQGGVAPCRRQPELMLGGMAAGRPAFVVQAGLWPFLTRDCP